ncbi:MAG TPA: hypothetical protein VET25_07600 [Aestuariivirgaceae bacterium]|nr:hypothetical protein [Aestuariivirgaceae bacterium]
MNTGVRIGGMVLVALGLLSMVLALISPGRLFEGLTLETGAVLLVGGVVALGLSGVITAVETLRAFVAGEDQAIAGMEVDTRGFAKNATEGPGPSADGAKPRTVLQETGQQVPEIGSRVVDMPKVSDDRMPVMKETNRSTIDRLVEDIHELDATSTVPRETVSEEELYVVEERTIAGKPARILSDGTVEAETDDGWMRFENAEHLEEYMDALRGQHG